jgi:hypothetical protein
VAGFENRPVPVVDVSIYGQPAGGTISSAPALAALLRQSDRRLELPSPLARLLHGDPLVQMYRVPAGNGEDAPGSEAQAAAHVLLAVADRLRRLAAAYGEWSHFDPSAYFDLTDGQAGRFLRIVERVTTVHVIFYADLLLPAYQRAEAHLLEHYRPAYARLRSQMVQGEAPQAAMLAFVEECQPTMLTHWDTLTATLGATRARLDDELGFWAANGSGEERARRREAWQRPPAPGVAPGLLPDLASIPTLTLAVDFPLPAYRQPGRLRRLRRQLGRATRRRAGD